MSRGRGVLVSVGLSVKKTSLPSPQTRTCTFMLTHVHTCTHMYTHVYTYAFLLSFPLHFSPPPEGQGRGYLGWAGQGGVSCLLGPAWEEGSACFLCEEAWPASLPRPLAYLGLTPFFSFWALFVSLLGQGSP